MKKQSISRRGSSPPEAQAADGSFAIVGIGASAGGLEVFTQLLRELPADTGMAFVLIQHLDPTHTSFLAEAMAKATSMPVRQAEDGLRVEPDHVYVIPPDADIAVLHGRLTLLSREVEGHKLHLPIDFFLRSLAADRGSHAIGIILSGTASDGTEGLRAIKAESGITFAQDPKSAKFGGMPHSAIEAGVVDYVMAVPAIAQEIVRLSRHPYVAQPGTPPPKQDESTLTKIFVIVRDAVGVDFSEYKRPTFDRRLARRMAVRHVDRTKDYLEILRGDPEEVRALYEDVLIHVTSFFRDPEVFDSLRKQVFPAILKVKTQGAPVRVWVTGCSTGEEVYSIAIALLEAMSTGRAHPIQIFGSDISDKSVEKARLGVFPESAMLEVSDERRRRYFTRVDKGYRINKAVRDLCVFVQHDLARDPPFARLDLVTCRNVLIYFDAPLQKRVLSTFHYTLNQPGFLLLGRTENVSGFSHLFSPTDKSKKVFARTATRSALQFVPRSDVHPPTRNRVSAGLTGPLRHAADVGKQLDRVLVSRFAPPSVLINDRMEILQFRGETGAFLQPASGEPQSNLLKMARGGLLADLRVAIAQAKKKKAPVKREGVVIDRDGARRVCDIEVAPFPGPRDSSNESLFVVLFEEVAKTKPSKATRRKRPSEGGLVERLERELAATREYLQSVVDDHGQMDEDLNAVNEELVSGNEELQSMNEELETAKEELQSTNEELTTVNEELHSRNQEVTVINSDLINLLDTVEVPVLMLDMARRIRRFTPSARNFLNLVPADVGRPLDDIKIGIQVPDLDRQIAEVIESNTPRESEVQDRSGRWLRMQIRPYKTLDNKIEGATLSLVDIDALKHHVADAQEARAEAERANRAKDQFMAVLSHELRTPLSSMLMQAQLLRRENQDAKVRHAGEVIERGTAMQVQLIEDLLDISRIVAGKLKMELRAVDLCGVVRAALESVSAPAERRSIRIVTDLDESMPKVSGDPTRLQQVVANLLTNAVKFTPEGGQVNLVLQDVNGRAHLTVSDTGIGIASEFLPHVFNRFSQEDGSNTRAYGGLGLGLAIVRHLVEAHGGTVTAASPGSGKGATFSVTLPLIMARADDLDAAFRSRDGDSARSGPRRMDDEARLPGVRVLVLDDDSATRDVVAEILSRTGADVRVADSAASGMQMVEEFRPQVLLCDIAMPGEDGYSFLRRLRARGFTHGGDIPALALTALAGEDDHERALAAGFQMHLAKPVDVDRLTQAVVALARWRAPSGASGAPDAMPTER